MTRREALSHTALLFGGVISVPVIAAVLQGCHANGDKPGISTFLSADQEKMVTEIVDHVLPKTSTPGAVEAGVPAFIFTVLQDCFSKDERAAFVAGLTALNELCKISQGRKFLKLSGEKQIAFLKIIDKETREAEKGSEKPAPHLTTWRRLKELTLVGYFTSEAGASQALEYVPVPGRLDTCMDLPQGQRAWAV